MDIAQFTITKHALERILDMGINADLIRQCLIRPERIRPQFSYPGRQCYDLNEITCVVEPSSATVITVLWRTPELWEKDIIEAGEYAGRTLREDNA